MRRIIASGTEGSVGLPIGNLTSQLFANVYLNELDRFVKQGLRARRYLRYMDDFLVFGDGKDELTRIKAEISRFLEDKLKLRLNEKKSFVLPVRAGVPFLGLRLFVCHRRLDGANVMRFSRRLRALKAGLRRGKVSRQELLDRVQTWTAHAAKANAWHLRERLLTGLAL